MIFLIAKYNKNHDQFVALIDYETELKVAWLINDEKIKVFKKGQLIKVIDVPHPLPENFFTNYCFEVSKGNL